MSYKVNEDGVELYNHCGCGEEIDSEDSMCRECWDESPERVEFLAELEEELRDGGINHG